MSTLREHIERAERSVNSVPTPALATEAMRKMLDGDERAKTVLKRWITDHPAEMIQALDHAVSEKLGYSVKPEPLCDRTLQCEAAKEHFLSCRAAPWGML